ncbi:MAG: ABC transporter substrate-binding protein [Bacteroidota bacterium]
MTKLTLALDWTPNVNHIGFFVAEQKGYYLDAGLDVTIISPAVDNYQLTPAKRVELGQADFALCPMESVLSYRTKNVPFNIKAIAAVFRKDVSAITVLRDSGIRRPKDLDGKVYASYKARYEDEIVKLMVKNDGGEGDIQLIYPEKLGIWENLVGNKSDATWIFLNWEGISALGKGIKLNTFKMADYGVPYSYSPVIIASEDKLAERNEAYSLFLGATKKGFLEAASNPEGAAKILRDKVADTDSDINLLEAIKYSINYFGDVHTWGRMELRNVQQYLNWIYKHDLESIPVTTDEMVTNELLTN